MGLRCSPCCPGQHWPDTWARLSFLTKVSRTVIHGPVLHVPEPEEFTHVFNWHGVDPKSKTHFIPGANVFQKLSVVPDQLCASRRCRRPCAPCART